MSDEKKNSRSLEKTLQSTSDVLFPEEIGDKLVEINSRSCDGDTPLHVMVWRRDKTAVEMLIKSGADINAVGDMGETPLHVAVRQKDGDIIKLLLDSGAKTDIRSEFNKTSGEI